MININTTGLEAGVLLLLGAIAYMALRSESLGLMQVINENPLSVLFFVFVSIALLKNGK